MPWDYSWIRGAHSQPHLHLPLPLIAIATGLLGKSELGGSPRLLAADLEPLPGPALSSTELAAPVCPRGLASVPSDRVLPLVSDSRLEAQLQVLAPALAEVAVLPKG